MADDSALRLSLIEPKLRLGASYDGGGGCYFCVWAPQATKIEVHLTLPYQRIVPLMRDAHGYHTALVDEVKPGARYFYRLDGKLERPDPASRSQPEGVHGASEVTDPRFLDWTDSSWKGLALEDFIIYELHVGTFTPEGTFDAIIPQLSRLRELGVTAIELMPITQFPGERNWGYDGVYPFAVQNTYGGFAGLKRLVDACHQRGLAVVLDVVYNHLGPEGNYLADFAPYFTDRYRTPWGQAINYDGPHSDEVRRFFLESALRWMDEFHIDAFRLDAIDAIKDFSARPFLQELASILHQHANALNRHFQLIAESDLNDVRVILPEELGGLGLDGQWSDDFHHSLHTLLTGERQGYYVDFGRVEHLARAHRDTFVYSGQYSSHRQRRHGNHADRADARQFVVCNQNHDQVGNRMAGERLSQLVNFEALKLAAGVVLLSPYIPLIFMGEEYGELAPFQYFTSHGNPALVKAVREGRAAEFASFAWAGECPDPQDEATFRRSKLNQKLTDRLPHRVLQKFYKEVIRLRRHLPALACSNKRNLQVIDYDGSSVLLVRRWADECQVASIFNFAEGDASDIKLPLPAGIWRKHLDSADRSWYGKGSELPPTLPSSGEISLTIPPHAFVVYALES